MRNHIDINDTRYVISRVFNENKTTSMLIEQRVRNTKHIPLSLVSDSDMMYNLNSGSIQSKEVLWESNKINWPLHI